MIKFKKTINGAQEPKRNHPSDSGYDVVSATDASVVRDSNGYIKHISYNTGISLEPPEDTYFLLYPRSSIRKYNLSLSNSVGVIDTSYRGDVIVCFTPTIYTKRTDDLLIYRKGDRIAQLIPQIIVNVLLKEVNSVKETERGSKRFGSSGC